MLENMTVGDVLWAVWQSIKQYWSWKNALNQDWTSWMELTSLLPGKLR